MTRPPIPILLAACVSWTCGQSTEVSASPVGPAHSVVATPEASAERQHALSALIAESRQGGGERGSFRPFDDKSFRLLHDWARNAARGEVSGDGLPARFAPPAALGSGVYVLHEHGSTNSGAGVYVVRTGRAPILMIHVPHSFWDVGTLPIGLSWFEGLRGDALLINTSHRYRGAGCDPPKADASSSEVACPSDAAHSARHPFHAFHTGYAEGCSSITTLAVHGFDAEDGDPDAIVSAAGTLAPLGDMLAALRSALPAYRILAYPTETKRLGGRSGVQARMLAKTGGRMLHIEMSRRLRDALASDQALSDEVVRALRRVWRPAR